MIYLDFSTLVCNFIDWNPPFIRFLCPSTLHCLLIVHALINMYWIKRKRIRNNFRLTNVISTHIQHELLYQCSCSFPTSFSHTILSSKKGKHQASCMETGPNSFKISKKEDKLRGMLLELRNQIIRQFLSNMQFKSSCFKPGSVVWRLNLCFSNFALGHSIKLGLIKP